MIIQIFKYENNIVKKDDHQNLLYILDSISCTRNTSIKIEKNYLSEG